MSAQAKPKKPKPTWARTVKAYHNADYRSWVQIANTVIPLIILYVLMYLSLSVSYLLTMTMMLPAAGFMVRLFIIQHDAGHGSFFSNPKWNNRIGILCSFITLTPYEFWRHSHAVHHAHTGDLEWRGTGDVYTMTFNEYRAASRRERLLYRIYRHPFMMIVLGPPLMFLILHRAPFALAHARSKAERLSIIRTDIGIAVWMTFFALLIGPTALLMIWLPTAFLTSSVGVWMFYVQHQFEDAYWTTKPDWDYATAALQGSTFYNLPKWMHWFTGNIGFHHIHHLSPKIPNYELEKAHQENAEFQDVPTLTLWSSITLVLRNLAIIDEETDKLIGFSAAHRKMRELDIAEGKVSINGQTLSAGTD